MRTLRDWLSSGPFSLGMSSGFFGFFAHAGMLSALEEEGFSPVRVTGSSAGALVGGMWAAGMRAAAIGEELIRLRREHFWDPGPGLGLLRGRLFRERLEALLPVRSFEECRVPAALSVFDVLSRGTRVLDRGPLAPAIQASCTVPFLFHPTWVGRRPLLDGGIADRPGLLGMPRGERVLFHHLAGRSPWRREKGASMAVPVRAGLVALVIEGLPRLGPFRLEQGSHAFESARESTRRALDMALDGDVVSLSSTRG